MVAVETNEWYNSSAIFDNDHTDNMMKFDKKKILHSIFEYLKNKFYFSKIYSQF